MKTVESHLAHAYRKLGISSRAALHDQSRPGSPYAISTSSSSSSLQ